MQQKITLSNCNGRLQIGTSIGIQAELGLRKHFVITVADELASSVKAPKELIHPEIITTPDTCLI